MRGITVLALVLIGAAVVFSAATPGGKPKTAATGAKKGDAKKGGDNKAAGGAAGQKDDEGPKAQLLRKNVVYATGYSGAGSCVPGGTIYYATTDKQLVRSDHAGSFKKNDVKIADNVVYAYSGDDDGVWYVDTDGKLWRLRYQGQPQQVPNQPEGVKFIRVSIRTYDDAFAVTEDGKLYHWISHEFVEDTTAKNVRDAGMAYDGTLMYVDKDNKIFHWDLKTFKWEPYEQNGHGFDMYDSDNIVIFDEQGGVQKRVNGTWTPVKESKCNDVFLNIDAFICITPDKSAKLVPY